MLAVATSAVRDAANRDDFLARVAASGFEPRLLSGEEEAATTFAGVCSRAPGGEAVSADGTLIMDVGGGSTELVLGAAGGVAWSRSLQAGCVRMTERFLGEDVVAEAALAACATALDDLLDGRARTRSIGATRRAIAVAGTATTLAAIAHGGYAPEAVHGARITRAQVRDLQARLAALPLAERREVPGLEPARAPGDRRRPRRARLRARPLRPGRGDRLGARHPARRRAAGRRQRPARLSRRRARSGTRTRTPARAASFKPAVSDQFHHPGGASLGRPRRRQAQPT